MQIPFWIVVLSTVAVAVAAWFCGLALGRARAAGPKIDSLTKDLARIEAALREEAARGRSEMGESARQNRQELSDAVERMRRTVEEKMRSLQDDNSKKLEHIRQTVDEKLHETLEKRLGDSFMQVSQKLEMVYRGLGEMQALAAGVGDLKKVLSNVKTRGVLGEGQLGTLLEDLLTPDQYVKNVATKKGSNDRVEYAIRLPECLLPIDAKFPLECYERMAKCFEAGDLAGADACRKELVAKVRDEAKSIRDKYVDPPNTTDYAILFVPFESVYAEVVATPGLHQQLQNDFQVTVAGPTNLGALLNSFRMGFRTLAIQKRSTEVWGVLGMVKNEFGKFAQILEKTQKKLEEATNTLDDATKKTRTIEKKLRSVEALPQADAKLIGEFVGDEEPFLSREPQNGGDQA